MKSIQIVGKSDELGIFSTFIRKGEKFEKIRKCVDLREGPSLFPWYERIRYYLS